MNYLEVITFYFNTLCTKLLIKISESAKLRALRALMSYVGRALRDLVPHVSRVLRVLVPHILLTLSTLVPHVPCVLSALVSDVPRALIALVLDVPPAAGVSWHTCFCASRAFFPTCLVLYVLP